MSELFELPYDPSWGYGRRFFLDVEHRYAKMHRLLREGYGDLVLCCHEPAGAFCHRVVLAGWLAEQLGEEVTEAT